MPCQDVYNMRESKTRFVGCPFIAGENVLWSFKNKQYYFVAFYSPSWNVVSLGKFSSSEYIADKCWTHQELTDNTFVPSLCEYQTL